MTGFQLALNIEKGNTIYEEEGGLQTAAETVFARFLQHVMLRQTVGKFTGCLSGRAQR